MIHIPATLLEEVLAHARSEAPSEVCGWLAGSLWSRRSGGGGGVEESGETEGWRPEGIRFESPRCDVFVGRIYPVPNVAEEPVVRFVMEPEGQLAAMREVRELGLELVGTYHSHPKSPAIPSERDREDLVLYPDIAHLIVSLAGPSFRCWRISERAVVEVAVERGGTLV